MIQRGFIIGVVIVAAAMGDCPLIVANDDAAKLQESAVTKEDREHWAFRKPRRATPPVIKGRQAERVRNAIDCFVIQRLAGEGLTLQAEAEPHVLMRRISFDLLGLPPDSETPQEFRDDRQWNRWLDACFSSPAYGERWAQHWLDLARFAETDGFEHDKVRDQAWRYRDWVVQAWNRHLPYDQFAAAQLAGDQAVGDQAATIATMFCTSGPDMPDINSQDERKHALLNEMTATVGSVFLAMQIGCAQCHDHKHDPISQFDFYRLRAYFEAGVQLERNKSVGPLRHKPTTDPTRLWVRGDWRRPGPEVAPAVPRVINTEGPVAKSRTAMAAWLTSGNHPLTARVIVNRLWQYHLGRGLVATPSDFGVMGEWPSHPELLDFLACELMDHDWSLQHIQRLILDSATYRQRSKLASAASTTERAAWKHALEEDPANRLLSRFPRKRLDGESVRDAMLAVSDSLNRTMGGPGVRPPLPRELKQTLLRNQWNESPHAADHYRRSIYVFARRNLLYPIFQVLDRPDANASCPRRPQSTTAPQALLLLNSPITIDAATRLAQRIVDRQPEESAQVREAFQRTLHRKPREQEVLDARKFLRQQRRLAADEGKELQYGGLQVLCLALFNSSEFLYLD